jgi:oxygen-independent coproporphyrinogen-3 oxidase
MRPACAAIVGGVGYPFSELVIDPVLVRKYDIAGPRYTSYPTADRFVEAFGEAELRAWLACRNLGGTRALSLYVHVPFCSTLCYYCACNKLVTRDRGVSANYIKYLDRELRLLGRQREAAGPLVELHLGGGTPTFLARSELMALMAAIDREFPLAPDCECSIEIDPREAPVGTMSFLAYLGFNRASFGVQDFDRDVQTAVNRIQSFELTRGVIAEARASGFRSVNLDLIYGLPKQTPASFNRTLDQVLELDPDRIALYSYAHLPQLFPPQRRVADHAIPSAELKLELLTLAIGRLTGAGYLYIGMDHFARPDDELALAQAHGRLQRSFQGYSSHPGDLLGIGVSAIGCIGPAYYQNHKQLDDYYAALDADRLPVARGLERSPDDLVRAAVMQALTCHFRVSIESLELAHLIDFSRHFAAELQDLRRLEAEGLVELAPDWIVVTPKGRLLVRAICMVFDRYLRSRAIRATYSKVI